MRRSIEHSRAQQEPHLVWNAFVDILAMEDYADLTPNQRMAHLVFWYDSEVQNGGHGQYFENRGSERLAETVRALTELGLPAQAKVLSRAVGALTPGMDWTELEDGFTEELDDAYNQCTPTVTEALTQHLTKHRAEYVEWT